MAKSESKVYLDHLIRRDSFLYQRQSQNAVPAQQPYTHLSIPNLQPGDNSKAQYLRKPDFQRATWAWSAEECVDLLESVLNQHVVPSVIMWLSPNRMQYVLDGGHRVSVLMAWIRDDWGDKLPADQLRSDALTRDNREAALKVRELLAERGIGSFQEHLEADRQYNALEQDDRSPFAELDPTTLTYAERVRNWNGQEVGFPILWVKGGYETAERSFLRINKTGRRLSDWETKLVEHRSSSFARAVMSIAHPHDAERIWPSRQDSQVTAEPQLRDKVNRIHNAVTELHNRLFAPTYELPIKYPIQPLLATPYAIPERKAQYLSELLTIVEGKRGSKPETEALIKKDTGAPTGQIVNNGLRLVENAQAVLDHVYGPTALSLTTLPLVYFYNPSGTFVRSLLYGLLYWLNDGSEEDTRNRKLVLTQFRGKLEDVLIEKKADIVRRITRRIGSGPEVTYPTARYYHGLLDLLVVYGGDTNSPDFASAHESLIERLGKDGSGNNTGETTSTQRTFRGAARAGVDVQEIIRSLPRCEICGGRFVAGHLTQVDHIQPHAKGGVTAPSNGRNTHPFCNNNRELIEELRTGHAHVPLPSFADPATRPQSVQLSFLLFNSDGDEAVGGED